MKELIKQKATIWSVDWDKIILNENSEIYKGYSGFSKNNVVGYCLYALAECDNIYHDMYFDTLYETEEEMNWELEFGNITRTETLNLPTWEDVRLLTKYTKYYFYGKDNALYGLCLSPEDSLTRFDGSIEELKSWCGIDVDGNCEIEHFEPLTKENYTLACRKAKELFLGEK